MRRISALVLILGVPALVACNVGDVDTGPGGSDDPNIPDPSDTQYQVACTAELNVTGSLIPSGVTPGEDCLPDGTWTLQVTVADMGDCAEVPINAEYAYVVSRDESNNAVMAYMGTDGNDELDRYMPGSSGGTCRANIEHHSTDDLEIIYLQPFEDDLIITGSGTYELWEIK